MLELFPGAKFVHIHRNPFALFRSTQHQVGVALQWYRLQSIAADELDGWIIERYKAMYDAFFSERELIPRGQFHEVCFEQLEQDPITEVERIYLSLGLPDFGATAEALRRYVNTLSGYKKNRFPELPSSTRERLVGEWGHAFKEWGYPTSA